ncbi:hypothetical protein [Paenarthrobacter ureafaciens]|uniref:hypothetical protein n=1 Tax=Paenarthrobacter ureafaciens TaxID=37931 RepID=UPI002DC01C7D|nr:hypothetical protein [Paenarthrobacter ureafaciens]MEC3853459.1 hypothetical protein [Paenarthrobacter ureafaciens]
MDREARAVQLKTAGKTYDEIATEVGYTNRSAARKAVVRALERRPAESVEEMRTVEGLRLDMLTASVWKIINDPEATFDEQIKAINAAVRISDSRAKLFGLYAPVKVEAKGNTTMTVVFSSALENTGGMTEPELIVEAR